MSMMVLSYVFARKVTQMKFRKDPKGFLCVIPHP